MRKMISIFLLSFLVLYSPAYPTSIGGAATNGKGKFSIGIETSMSNRDLSFSKANWDISGYKGKVKVKMENFDQTMVKASYGLFDNFDVYAKLGISRFETKLNYSGIETGKGIYDGNSGLIYGFGAKATHQLKNNLFVGVDLQYLSARNKWSPKGDFQGEGNNATIKELQVAPYIYCKIKKITPYIGIKYSNLSVKTKWADGKYEKYSAADNVGIFLGADYKLTESWALNLEGRFVDETAMSMAATYKF